MSAQRVFIVAGETSGDAHGAGLMKALRERDQAMEFAGLGGPEMAAIDAGVRDWTEEAAVVGLAEVLKKYSYFKEEFDKALEACVKCAPQTVVLVDYPGFNLRLAEALRKRGLETRIVYYISPQVWAWKRGRIAKMAKTLDRMLCLFPFEVPMYERSGLEARFVGHPMGERLGHMRGDASQRNNDLVALLPGSRAREIEKIFPVLLGAAAQMQKLHPGMRFAASAANDKLAATMQEMADSEGVDCAVDVGNAYELMAHASCGAVASGTATLEAAFLGLPYCLVYKVAWPTYYAARLLMAVEHLGMANLLAGRELVREYLQADATPDRVAAQLLHFVENRSEAAALAGELQEITAPLADLGAYERAAEGVLL